jgi:UDPglucose 6-dehydrogenase
VQVSVIGAGYVGLVTAGCLAAMGNDVRVVDIDEARVARLRRAELPIREAGLDELVRASLEAGRLRFDVGLAAARGGRLAIVCVGTLDADGEWTGDQVRRAILGLAADRQAPRGIVIRSTLMPGTTVRLLAQALELDRRVELAVNPEFTREASAVQDFMHPDRVVIGVAGEAAASTLVASLTELYSPLSAPLVITDPTSAEAIKVASNVFLAAKITYANELARLCAAVGADVQAVVDGLGMDKRIGRSFLSPGPGYGGSCLPAQARALPELARRAGVETRLMAAITSSNEDQAEWLVGRLEAASPGALSGSRVALLGLTFKAGTDDLRESPAFRLARSLAAHGAIICAYDPVATLPAVEELAAQGIEVSGAASSLVACADADAVVIATEWPEFRSLPWADIAAVLRGKLVADARNVVDVDAATAAGLSVLSLGSVRGPAKRRTGDTPREDGREPSSREADSGPVSLVSARVGDAGPS